MKVSSFSFLFEFLWYQFTAFIEKTLSDKCVFLLQGQIQRQLNWLEADLIKVKFQLQITPEVDVLFCFFFYPYMLALVVVHLISFWPLHLFSY